MLLLASCPRCGGDVKGDHDTHGTYFSCLQCGWVRDIQPDVLKDRLAEYRRTHA